MSAARALSQSLMTRTLPAQPLSQVRPREHLRVHLLRDIDALAGMSGTPLTLRELFDVGRRAQESPTASRLHSAQWLHNELPIRLAHRVRELAQLPHGLAHMPSVIAVRDMYENSFDTLRSCALPRTAENERDFSQLLANIRRRHDSVVRLIAKGVIELKAHCGKGASDLEIRSFLDRFYMSRIGIRVLISHHLALGSSSLSSSTSTTTSMSNNSISQPSLSNIIPNNNQDDEDDGMAGIINTRCKPATLISDAVSVAQSLSYQHYGDAPRVDIRGNTELQFPYIDSHMQLCLLELLKNSLRATTETHRDSPDGLPPVRVIIADGVEDVTIKISDEGGGFRRSELGRVWSYLFTTARLPAQDLLRMEDQDRHSNRPDPIAGFGYGLPLSRLYARYWGGELGLTSMEGYGTDAYLHLSKLGNKKECLFS